MENNYDNSNIEINKYLSQIVSGEYYSADCHLGSLCGSGRIYVTIGELEEMVSQGVYNIIKAHCINPEMIEIEYQEYTPNRNLQNK